MEAATARGRTQTNIEASLDWLFDDILDKAVDKEYKIKISEELSDNEISFLRYKGYCVDYNEHVKVYTISWYLEEK